jgi:hypothetical protein
VIVQTFVGRLDRLRTEGRKREREKAELVKSSRIFGVFAFFLLLLDLCVSLSGCSMPCEGYGQQKDKGRWGEG